jgi:hypothetical protein
MANFTALQNCLNTGALLVPPVAGLAVTSTGGGTATIQNPSATTPYNFNLPIGPGSPGQLLTSAGGGSSAMTWTTPASVTPPIVDGIPIARPAGTTFSWMNQGGASYAEYINGPLTISIPAQSGDQLRGLSQSPPGSTPYTLTVKIDTLLWGKNFYNAGIFIIDSSGRVLTLSYQTSTGSSQTQHAVSVIRWNSSSSFSSTQMGAPISESRTWWLRVNNDGTNWNFSISHNGADWMALYSEGVSAFLGSTISGLGVFGDNNDTAPLGLGSLVSIWSYELASGSGTNSSW